MQQYYTLVFVFLGERLFENQEFRVRRDRNTWTKKLSPK